MVCNVLMDSKQKNVMFVNLMSHTVGTTLLLLSSLVAGGGTALPPRRPTQFFRDRRTSLRQGDPKRKRQLRW